MKIKRPEGLHAFSPYRLWSLLPRLEVSNLPDVIIFAAALALFYALLAVARTWFGPYTPQVQISRSPLALVTYAGYSMLRIAAAYVLSLGFALVYGYVAAYTRKAEKFLIPLLDVLQSIPVLNFLPGVMLAMVALSPTRQLGLELGAVLLIFTGQAWNMAFSFYASLKTVPSDMREAARAYRFSAWQRFTRLELPFAAIGLVWNSMMSVAGGWFFLMACEMFVLGARDFPSPRPGIVPAGGRQRWRYTRYSLGCGCDDRRGCAARPVCLAAGDRLGGEVQDRAGRKQQPTALLGSSLPPAFPRLGVLTRKNSAPFGRERHVVFCGKQDRTNPLKRTPRVASLGEPGTGRGGDDPRGIRRCAGGDHAYGVAQG